MICITLVRVYAEQKKINLRYLCFFLQPKLMQGGNYIAEGRDSKKSTWLLFSPETPDQAGSLEKFLSIFSSHGVNLSHIESRSSARRPGYEFMVECEHESGDFGAALDELKKSTGYLNIISRNYKDNRCKLLQFFRLLTGSF